MRLTRAALRTESSESIETADASNLQSDAKARIPLGEVSANALSELIDLEDTQTQKMPPKKSKKAPAKKATKGQKTKAVQEEDIEPQVLEDERQAAGSPASDAAVDDLANGPTNDIVQVPMNDMRPASPPSRAVRMTRRQLAKLEEELSKSQRLASMPSHPQPVLEEVIDDTPSTKQEPEVILLEAQKVVEIPAPEATIPDVIEVSEPKVVVPGMTQGSEPKNLGIAEPEVEVVKVIQETEFNEGNLNMIVDAEVTAPQAEETQQAPELVEPEASLTTGLEPKTLATTKPCEETPASSRGTSRTPSRSPSKSPIRLEESFEAIDALEEALDKVGQAVPLLDHSSDEKSPRKARFDVKSTVLPNQRIRVSSATRNASPAPKVSRNPSSIRSLKPPTLQVRSSLSRSVSARAAASKDARKGSGEVADYLASKRRPISMSFPAPPPPPKSSKPPTQSTFQLPGEAVAAKLKAQKEERLRREEQGEVVRQSRPISMPPRPKSTRPPTIPTFQLPGEAVAAKLKAQKEERLRREENGEIVKSSRPISMPPPPKSSKPPTIANFQLPGEVIAAKLRAQKEERLKREEEEAAAKKNTFKARPAPVRKDVPAPVRQTSASRARENLMAKESQSSAVSNNNKRNSAVISRPTFNLSTTNSNRNSLLLSQGVSIITPADAAAQRIKAREQFLKEKAENESKRKERLMKEEAAKRAREEAAERGRIASREWAEKQKRKAVSSVNALRVEESA